MTRGKATEPSCNEALRCAPAAAIGWKVNVILIGVGGTFAAVIGLVRWTVERVDQIEVRAVTAAEARAGAVAFDAVQDARKAWREDLAEATRRLAVAARVRKANDDLASTTP